MTTLNASLRLGMVTGAPLEPPVPPDPPNPEIVPVQTVSAIDSASTVSQIGPGVYHVFLNGTTDGGAGIRFRFALADLVPDQLYDFAFTLSAIEGADAPTIMADACDDGDQGPFLAGDNSFQWSRSSFDNTYRFVDVWDALEFNVGSFIISGVSLMTVV